jgi:hypothetical protein
MGSAINEVIKRQVIEQWLSGEARDKIAADNNIGAGTVTSIVSNYKVRLGTLDFDLIRQLSIEMGRQGLNFADLASHFRLYNYFIKSGAAENKLESFIDNINSSNLAPEKAVEYVNQLFAVSREQSIPPDEVSSYIQQKIQEKQKIEEEIKEAGDILQSRNVSIEAINQHIQLNEALSKYGLSTKDIHRLRDLLIAAKKYRYSPGKIIGKLRSIKGLENKEIKLNNSYETLSKQLSKYKEILPLAELVHSMNISGSELIS